MLGLVTTRRPATASTPHPGTEIARAGERRLGPLPGRELTAIRNVPSSRPAQRRRLVTLSSISFLLVVVLPTLLAGIYYLAVASDQYVSELRFSLRTSDTPRLDALALFGNAAHEPGAAESHIVVQYLASRAAVDDVRQRLDLEAVFAPPRADWWARLHLPASSEALVEYWRGQVDPFYDPANGTVTVQVRAFSPEDSLRLAQGVVAAAENLVNDLSLRARRDALRHAEAEVTATEARLKTVLGQIRQFREQEGVIDPAKTAEASAGVSARLSDELARTNAELATLQAYMHDAAPPVKVLKAKIRSLEYQKRAAVHDLTDPQKSPGSPGAPGSHGSSLTRILSSYEQLDSERKFAETSYQHALAALDRARAETDRQQVYIASFVPPSLPEEALYPRRWRSLGIVTAIAFALWAIGGLAIQSIREHV